MERGTWLLSTLGEALLEYPGGGVHRGEKRRGGRDGEEGGGERRSGCNLEP